MSLSGIPTSSEKDRGKPGIFRIFRQSILALGRLPQSDFKHFRKESDVLKQSEQTDKSVSGKKKNSVSYHKEVKRQSAINGRDKDNKVGDTELNSNGESLRKNDSESTSAAYCDTKRRVDGFCRYKVPSGFTQRNVLDENSNKINKVVNFHGGTDSTESVRNVLSFVVKKQNVNDFDKDKSEDWENELVDLKIVDECYTCNQEDNRQNIFGEKEDSMKSLVSFQPDINNNHFEEADYTENLESKSELETPLCYEYQMVYEHTAETDKTDNGKEISCTDLDTKKVQKLEETIKDKQSLPLRSTPKNSNTLHVVDKEFDNVNSFSNNSLSSSSPDIVKQIEEKLETNLNISTGRTYLKDCKAKKEGHTGSSEELSTMRNCHNNSRTFGKGEDYCRNGSSKNLIGKHHRSKFDFDLPPRFKANNGSGDGIKLEKANSNMRDAGDNEHMQRPQRHRFSRNFIKDKSVEQHGKHFNEQNRMQLLDLKIKTPVKFKAGGSGFNRMNSSCRIEVENKWEIPASEDWSLELLDLDAVNVGTSSIADKVDENRRILEENQINKLPEESLGRKELQENFGEKNLVIHNHEEQYFPLMPPYNFQDILHKIETIPKEVNVLKESAGSKEHEFEHESVCKKISVAEKGSAIGQKYACDKDIVNALSAEDLMTSHKLNVYLPPIPAEVLESGDKETWTNEMNRKFDSANQNKGLNRKANIVVTNQEETANFPFENSQNVESNEIKRFPSEYEYANKHLQGFSEQNNETNEIETIEIKLDITECERNIKKKEVIEDNYSISSLCENQDNVCINSVNENMTSEADVSDIPINESQGWENERSSGFCCEKVDQEGGSSVPALADMKEEHLEYDTGRNAYEQYMRYWYNQDRMNADVMQRGQFAPWYHNYQYNYEACHRWLEQMQMNYYWDMYNRQMQYSNQIPYYWYGETYLCPDESNTENFSSSHANEDNTWKHLGNKDINKRQDKKKSDHGAWKQHSKHADQLKATKNSLDNEEELNSREYKSERMHQWVNKHSPEVTNHKRPELEETDSLHKCSLDDPNFNVRKSKDRLSNGFQRSKVNFAESEKSLNRRVKKQKDESYNYEEKKDGSSKGEKSELSCTCTPSQVTFMVWRTCACEAGNPTRLHKIISSGFDERSVDLGYQSIESLEHDESGARQIASRAPGFVIQPLCSTPAIDNRNTDLLKHKKVHKETLQEYKSDREKSVKELKIRPPPGFESVVYTDMEYSRNKVPDEDEKQSVECNINSELHGRSDNGTASKPSLRSTIQQKGLQYGQKLGSLHCVKVNDLRQEHCTIPTDQSNHGSHDNKQSKNDCLPISNGKKDIGHLLKASLSVELKKHQENDSNLAIPELKFQVEKNISSSEGFDGSKYKKVKNDANCETDRNELTCETREMSGNGKLLPITGSNQSKKLKKQVIQEETVKSPIRMNDFVVQKEQFEREDTVRKVPSAISFDSSKYESSSVDYCETSGDENNNFSVQTQSPPSSENEEVLNVNRNEKVKINKIEESSKMLNRNFERQVNYELSYNYDDEEIPVNEIMEVENKADIETVGSNQCSGEINGPRASFQPRSLYPCPLPPYRVGPFSPRLPSFSHVERWSMDPRFLPIHMPLPMQLPSRSPPYQMFGSGPKCGYEASWEPPKRSGHFESEVNYRDNSQNDVRFPSPFPSFCHKQDRDNFKEVTKNSADEKRNSSGATQKARPTLNHVEYGSSEGSSSEIEPFDIDSLRDTDEDTGQHVSQQMQITKKLKTDSDDSSSVESFDVNQKENRVKMPLNSTAGQKLTRGCSKKLKQKTLKSFSTTDRQQLYPKVKEDTQKAMIQEQVKKRTLASIIAETCLSAKSAGRIQSDTTDAVSPDVRLQVLEEKQLPPLPPLPPFPNSPFWSLYSTPNNSALEGKSKDYNEDKQKDTNLSVLQIQRKWLPKNPSQRYSFSPGQGGMNSPSETDSEAKSTRSDWMTNFKIFHDFGVRYIDTHCHLDFLFSREGFKGSFKAYMDKHSETFPDMFEGCVAVFCNPRDFTPNGGLWLDVAKEPNVWIAMGCHPKMATDFTAAAELGLKKCLRHTKCIALGEIGLDYSGTFDQHAEVQKQVFRRQLKMAIGLQKVLVIHCREAEKDCLEIMKEMVPRNWKIHCHCFTNSFASAKLWIDAFPNLFIGVTPLVTYRTARPSHDLARNLPIYKLLLETDAPYFVPRCIPKEDFPLSNPGLAITVAKEIAQYQELPVAAVLRQCRLNTKFMYGI